MKFSKHNLFFGLLLALFTNPQVLYAQQKIGYINSIDLMQAMPEMTEANRAFKAFQEQKQLLLDAMDKERQKKFGFYEDKYKTISEANRDTIERELRLLENEIRDISKRMEDVGQKSQQEVSDKEENLYSPIIQKAKSAIQVVATEKGYNYVLDISQPDVVYFAGGDDLLLFVKIKLGIGIPHERSAENK